MSVIVQLDAKTWAQGYGPITLNVNITNSGNENIEDISIKVTDSVVFDALKARAAAYVNCLNVFSTGRLRFYVGASYTHTLPAGITKVLSMNVEVKPAAPIQVHNLACEFQYTVY